MTPALTNNPLFRGITPEKLSANLEEISFHTRSYRKGEILARQGDVCNRLVILTKGSVRGEMIDYSGRLINYSAERCHLYQSRQHRSRRPHQGPLPLFSFSEKRIAFR